MLFLFCVSSSDISKRIDALLTKKKNQEAYSLANSEILKVGMLDADPQLFYLRGQAECRLRKYDDAITDLSRFLTGSKSSSKAQIRTAQSLRGIARLRLGYFEDASSDANVTNDKKLNDELTQAQQLNRSAFSYLKDNVPREALSKFNQLLKICPSSAAVLADAAEAALLSENMTYFTTLIDKAVSISPNDKKILFLRGRYYLNEADFAQAGRQFQRCSESPQCTRFLRASTKFQNEYKEASALISKKNFSAAEAHIAILNDLVSNYSNAKTSLGRMLTSLQVKILVNKGKKSNAVSFLNDLISAKPNDISLLNQRGQLLTDLGDYEGALKDFQAVKKVNKNNKEAINGIKKVSGLQDKEKQKDYYELLGVKKGASLDQVKAAYKKSVIQNHPDRYRDPIEKKLAEGRMKMINRAYDVIGDPQKKRMYDLGQNPDEPPPPPPDDDQGYRYQQRQGGGFPNGGFSGSAGGFPGFDFGDIFKMFTGGGGGGQQGFTFNMGGNQQQQRQQQAKGKQQQAKKKPQQAKGKQQQAKPKQQAKKAQPNSNKNRRSNDL